ncbi:MAG: prepilin peptidase CpaA [Psychromonas sp.]|jgi:prepilin peptidase CpaA|uniref:A24 family peptidase n=1 Tax=Psychromonas sp. TaxID=1884585 RepID=UPI0039E6B9C7
MEDFSVLIKLSIILLVFSISLYFDLRYQRIPNRLCVITLTIGFVVQSYFAGWAGLLTALLGAGVAFLLLFPAFALKLLGAGDVKLMVAIGAFLDIKLLLWTLIYAVIAGALTSIFLALYKLGWRPFKEIFFHYLRCLYLRQFIRASNQQFLKMQVPYAPALAMGWVWACSQNEQIVRLIANFNYQFGV